MDVEVRALTRTFGSLRANDEVSLAFASGQIHGVLGENGAGKSTLMKLLAGFLTRTSGTVLLNRQPVQLGSPVAALAAGVGMVHQDPMDVPAFTALENFFCASPRALLPDMATARRRLHELTKHLDFSVPPNVRVARLTVGQRQQLEIARLLACGVQVLILDEPTTGITAAQKVALFAALRQLVHEGKTVLFVSHKLDEVAELCDTVSVLRAGRVMGAGQLAMPQPQDALLALMFGQDSVQSEYMPQRDPPPPQPADQPPTWQLAGIAVREGNLALRDLHLTLPPGTILGLSGLEGSGQQLLLRLLAGRLLPTAGQLWLQDRDVTHATPETFLAAGVQYLPADRMNDGLIGPLTLSEHVILSSADSPALIDRRQAQADARAAIADYDIRATPATPLAALSGGNQQRAMLSLLPPHCTGLLLDQPTRGLDVISARAVWQRLLARRQAGTTLVFASADFDELLAYSDHILVFFAGRVSRLLPREQLTAARLAELIGGVGFDDA